MCIRDSHDVMKGALYVLGSKATQNLAILSWTVGPHYLRALLGCQHQERPSVQSLVRTVTHDFIIRLGEPSTLKSSVDSQALQRAADVVEGLIEVPEDKDLVARVAEKAKLRTEQKNAAYDELVRPYPAGEQRHVLVNLLLSRCDSCPSCWPSLRTRRRTTATSSSAPASSAP